MGLPKPTGRGWWGIKKMFATLRRFLHEPSAQLSHLNILDCRYVVIDTELTGLDARRDSIVSIGAVRMDGCRIDVGGAFYRLINPSAVLRPESVVVHGITPSEVEFQPPLGQVIDEFIDFCKDAVVVGHFLSLDLEFLGREMKRIGREPMENPGLDTHRIHEWITHQNGDFSRHFGEKNEGKDLFSLAKRYHIEISEAHNAVMDAFVTAQLFQRFLRALPKMGVFNVRDLLRVGRP